MHTAKIVDFRAPPVQILTMDGGRPERSQPRSSVRWARRLAWVIGGLLALALVSLALAPLLLRGPVLRWAVARATEPLCGEVHLRTGRLAWTLIPDLVLERPLLVEVEDASVRAPDGKEVMAVGHARGRVQIKRNPLRIVIEEAAATDGRWRMLVDGPPGAGFLDALRTVPSGRGREACFEVRARTRVKRPASSGAGGKIDLVARDVRLRNIDVDLDFPDWGLKIPRVSATGSFGLSAPGSAGVLFEAHDVLAPSAQLRVARAKSGGETNARFDEVFIPYVGLTMEHPTDIALRVSHARSGRSNLSGTARFTSVFRMPGQKGRLRTGMVIDARWTDTADAIAGIRAAWLPPGATLEPVGLGGLITARLEGPFAALSGTVSATGPRTNIRATVEQGRRISAEVRVDGVDTTVLSDGGAAALLGGVVTGHVRAHAAFGDTLAATEAAIEQADIEVKRTVRDAGPRRFSLRVGPHPRGGTPMSTADAFALDLGHARLREGTLELGALRARWGGIDAGGRLALVLPRVNSAGVDAPADLDATIDVGVKSVERWVAAETLEAHGTARARVTGPLNGLRVRVALGPESRLTTFRLHLRPPRVVTATFDGDAFTLAPMRIENERGGVFVARMRTTLAGAVSGRLEIEKFPLGVVPGMDQIRPPPALGMGKAASLAAATSGTLDASMDVHGTLARPVGEGRVALNDLRLADRPVSNGLFNVHVTPQRLSLEGNLGPTLSASGWAEWRGGKPAATANMTMRSFSIAPWVPPPLGNLPLKATGQARVSVDPAHPQRASATLAFDGDAGHVVVEGDATGTRLRGKTRGHVDLMGMRPLWLKYLAKADGAIDADVAVTMDLAHPAFDDIKGTVDVTRAVEVRTKGSPLPLRVLQGGRLELLEGARVRTSGMSLATDGASADVRGEAMLAFDALARTRVDVSTNGRIDAAELLRRVRLPWLASASGTVMFQGRAQGQVDAPALTGDLRVAGVQLRPASAGWPSLRVDGTIEANGHMLRTRGLQVQADPAGTLTVGRADAPAFVELMPQAPLRLKRLDVPVAAHGLRFGDARTALQIGQLDLALRVVGDPQRALTIAGDVGVSGARFDPGRMPKKKKSSAPSRPWYESLPPNVFLDVTLHDLGDPFRVSVPGPDVAVKFKCRVQASARGAWMSGQLHGSGAYSSMALTMYDWFSSQDVRGCRVMK